MNQIKAVRLNLDPQYFPVLTSRYTPDRLRDMLVSMCQKQNREITAENLHSVAVNLESDLRTTA